MLSPFVRQFLIASLEGTPEALTDLLGKLPAADPVWDFQPDPDRFTLREVIAHLADWEPINRERLTRIVQEDQPSLPDVDEGALAVAHGYSSADPVESLRSLGERRLGLLEYLRDLPVEAWERIGNRETPGRVRLADLVTVIALHDAYHIRQAARWLAIHGA